MEPWIIWIIACTVLVIIEVLTQAVWTLCFAIGCIAAVALYFCGAPTEWQIITMAIAALAAYIILVPWFKKWHEKTANKEGRDARTGMEALLGRKATVTHEIKPGELGRARIDGDIWQVRAPGVDTTIHRGAEVTVTSFESIILTVSK